MKWQRIPAHFVRDFWKDSNGELHWVNPDWYAENGIPCGGHGEDMTYSHTEVFMESSDGK